MKNVSLIADRFGIAASTACAVHCLLLPALLVAGTTASVSFLEDERFHQAMLAVVVPAALVAFVMGCRQHKDRRVMLIGGVGLTGIVSAVFLHDLLGETGERVMTLIAACLLVAAHVRNYRLCRSTDCES